MKILVLIGSPRRNGATSALVDSFTEGAISAGHQVTAIRCSEIDVKPCTGCGRCRKDGPCRFEDDMEMVKKHFLESDLVVYATPVYYAGFTAQIKTVMDRCYSFNTSIKAKPPMLALITSAHEKVASSTTTLVRQYEEIAEYFGSENKGVVSALHIAEASDLEGKGYLEEAYELGRSL